MKVAVIGTGHIGGALAKSWGKAGHEVLLGARNPQKPEVQQLVQEIGSNARAIPPAEAAAQADAVLFAVPGAAMAEAVPPLAKELSGKVVIDATNNRGGGVMNNVDKVQAAAPDAQLYRTFNTYGWENLANPTFGGERPDLFYVGPEGESQAKVEQLINDAGLRPIRIGGLDNVQLMDQIVFLWFSLTPTFGRHVALKVITD